MSLIMRGSLLPDSEEFKTSTHFEMLSTDKDNEYRLVYCMSLDEGDLSLERTVTLEKKLGYSEIVEHGATICMQELNKCLEVFKEVKSVEKDLDEVVNEIKIVFRRR